MTVLPTFERVPERPTRAGCRDRVFILWLAVNAASLLGDGVWLVAFAWSAIHLASPALAAVAIVGGAVPRGLFLLLGGAFADRFRTRSVMTAVAVARVLATGATLVVLTVAQDSIWLLIAVALVLGATDAFYMPASMKLARELATDDLLRKYQSASEASSQIAGIAGAGIGGLVFAQGGMSAAAWLNCGSFLLVLLYFTFLYPRTRTLAPQADHTVTTSIRGGLALVRNDRLVGSLVVVLSGSNLFVTPVTALGLALKIAHYDWGATMLGVVIALIASGAALGALAAGRYRGEHGFLGGVLLLVMQGAVIACLAIPNEYALAIGCAVLGATLGAAGTLLSAFFVQAVPSDYIGRVAAAQNLVDELLAPALTVGFGALSRFAGVNTPFEVFGGLMCLLMLTKLRGALRAEGSLPGVPCPQGRGDSALRGQSEKVV